MRGDCLSGTATNRAFTCRSVLLCPGYIRGKRGASANRGYLVRGGRIWLVYRLSLLDWTCAIYQRRGTITAIAFCLSGLAFITISFLGDGRLSCFQAGHLPCPKTCFTGRFLGRGRMAALG